MPKNKASFPFSSKILTLGCSALAITMIVTSSPVSKTMAQDVAALTPKSDWNLKSDANKTNGYCALSRAFDENVILTLGRNQAEEYSLAIDFQKAKLDPDKAYSVTLQPGPGQIRAYEMMPASARAMVVRLGYDDSFFKALETSKMLKAEVNKVKYNFQVNDIGQGRQQLNDCLAKIKGDAPTKTAQNFKAEKIEETEKVKLPEPKKVEAAPAKVADVATAKVKAVKPIEIQKAAAEVKPAQAKAPKDIKIERVAQKELKTEVKPVPATAESVKIETPKVVAKKSGAELKKEQAAKVETAKAEVAKTVAPKAAAPKTASMPAKVEVKKAAAPVMATKIEKTAPKLQRPTEMARNSRLSSSASTVSNSLTAAPQAAVPKATVAPKTAIVKPDVKKQEPKQIKTTKAETPIKVAPKKEIKTATFNDVKAPITPEMLNAPKPFSSASTPKTAVEKVVVAPTVADKKVEQKKQVVKAEAKSLNQKQKDLAKAVEEQKKKLSSLDQSDSKNEVQINNIREEIAILRIENRKLIEDAQKARAQLDSVAVESGNQALKRIREYERKLEAAKADNIALSRQMEDMQRLKEQGRLNQVNGDASLTQTTSRYNEAEREIKRLGLLLEQQRASHSREKQELEQMLFDPAVTNDQQRRKLAELERKLQNSEQQYARAQEELQKRSSKPEVIVKADPKVALEKQRLAVEKLKLEQELKAAKQQLAVQQQVKPVEKVVVKADPKVEAEKQRLAQEKIKLERELQAAQSQLKQTQVALKEKQMQKPVITTPDPLVQRNNIQIEQLNKKLELQNKQLEAYQRKIALEQQEQEALKQQAQMAAKQAAAAANQARLAQQSMEESKRQAASQKAQALQLQQQQVAQQRAAQIAAQQQASQMAAEQQRASFNKQKIETLLNQSGLSPNGGVQQVNNNEYRWNIGAVNGVAKIAAKNQTPNMNTFMKGYVANAKQSCRGDFASLASQTGQPNSYEIACVGGLQSRSSSVVFMESERHYVVISHETSTDDMDMAMDARDRIADKL